MAPDVRMRWPTEADVAELAANMRPSDAEEVLASGGFTPLEAVEVSVRGSSHAATLLIDGRVACIFGVAPLTGGEPETALGRPLVGSVWLLSTGVVDAYPKVFLSLSKRVLPQLLDIYPCLFQAVDARYTRALQWLERIGFEIQDPLPYGHAGLPFHPVMLRRPHV